MITQTKNYDPLYSISRRFRLKDLASPDGYVIWNDNVAMFVKAVEEFLDWYNREVKANSWYRTKAANKKTKGSSNSMHLYAMAIDFDLPGEFYGWSIERKKEFWNNIADKWREICKKYGRVGSLERGTRHMHLDFRNWADGKFHVYDGKSY